MVYGKVKLDPNEVSHLLPKHVINLIEEDSVTTIAGCDDYGKMVSLAFLKDSPVRSDECVIVYYYVAEGYRQKGLCKDLLLNVTNSLYESGYKAASIKVCGTPENNRKAYTGLLKQKFIPVTFNGHLVTYYVENIIETEYIERMEELKEKPELVNILDRKNPALKRFSEKAKRRGVSFFTSDYDTTFSKFFYGREDIEAVLATKLLTDEILLLDIIYVDPTCDNNTVLPCLFASVLKEAVDKLPENARIIVQAHDDGLYNTLMKVLGEGEEDLMIQDYVKILNGR